MLSSLRRRLEALPPLIAGGLLVVLPVVYRPMGTAPEQAAPALLGPKTLIAAMAALALAGLHLLLALTGRRTSLPRPVSIALACFVGAFVLSAMSAGFADPAAARALQHVMVFAAILVCTAATPGGAGVILTCAAIGGAIGAVLVSAQAYGWNAPGIHWESDMALPAGTFPNRNFAAYPIAAGLISAAHLATAGGRWPRRIAMVALAAVCTLGLVLSASRGAWLACLAAALLVTIHTVARQRPWLSWVSWRTATAFAAIVAVVIIGTAMRPEPATAEAREQEAAHPTDVAFRLDVTEHHESVTTRLQLWRGAWSMARDRPLLGWGTAGYHTRIEQLAPGGAKHTHAHNEVLHVAAVAGFPAALALIALLAAVVAVTVRRWWRGQHTPLVLVALLPVALGPPAIEIMTMSPVFGPVCAVLLGAALSGMRRTA